MSFFWHLPQSGLIQAARAAILKPPNPRHLQRRFVFAPQVAGKINDHEPQQKMDIKKFLHL
jgi:hypothetical protein